MGKGNFISSLKSTFIGILMLVWSAYQFNSIEKIEIGSFDCWYICVFSGGGFILFFTGDKWIDKFIELIFNKVKKILE